MHHRKMMQLRCAEVARSLVLGALLVATFVPPSRGQCQRAKLTAADGAPNDHFGEALGVSDGLAMIGAHRHDLEYEQSGAVYVFERVGAEWSAVAEFCLSQGEMAGFGRPVALEADLAVIGGVGWPRVFERLGQDWMEICYLRPDDYETGDAFGESLAITGDTVIVGAPHDDDNGWRSGSAYVFERDPNGVWLQAAKLLANDGGSYDNFGYAVAIDGDVAVMGAPDDDDLGNYSGSAYVFERDSNGVWSQAAKLLPHDGDVFWNFGESVAVSGQRVLVGATTAFAFAPAGGAAYVFEPDGSRTWTEVDQLVSDDIATADAFGAAVALSSDVAVIGAWGDDEHGEETGAAYVFSRQPNRSWTQLAKLVPDDAHAYDRFGSVIDLSGNTAVVGAYYDDDHGEDSGSAYVFAVGPDEDADGIMDVCLCPGDLDGDLDVDLADLAQLLSNYGTTGGAAYEDGDLDEDGDVDLTDLAALLAEYGTICP
jgi:hypothetical protein